ncbi:MAG: hypothetical protein IJ176_01355 [Prevotella sp.]|nr:hypothetical protein [Prevotella sp.]
MKRLLTLCLLLVSLIGARAQSWWGAPDAHQFNDETVVFATLQLNNHAVGADNGDYDVAAFIGDECRAVTWEAVRGEQGQTVFVLRVYGDRDADHGRPVRFEIRYKPGQLLLVYDVEPSVAVTFDGESWGQPSQPVVLRGKGYDGDAAFRFRSVTIDVGETVDILSLYEGETLPKYESIELSAGGIVSLEGTVATGLVPGTVIFDVHFPGTTLQGTITVVRRATAVRLLNDEVRVDIARPKTLQPKLDTSYELLPENTTEVAAWLIDDETIVCPDAEGNLIPKAVGETYVTPVILADDGSVRLRPEGRIRVIVYENVALQHFEYTFDSHPYNRETVRMTLTPVPANATFDIRDLRFRYTADYGWEQQWDIVSFELVSRDPIIYNVTFQVPIGVDVRPYWADAPESDIQLWPSAEAGWDPGIMPRFRLDLREGWQWRTNPCGYLWDDDLVEGFGPDLIEARTQETLLYNDPEWGYFGTMMEAGGIDDNVAYKVRMAADYRSRTFGLTVTGTSDFRLPVTEGWTWMPSPYLYDRRLENIFDPAQLTEGMTIISKEQGSAEWDGSQWQGDLEVLPTEQSFLLYMPEGGPASLTFRNERQMAQGHETAAAPARRLDAAAATAPAEIHTTARRFRDNMTMVVTMPQLSEPDAYQIEAYVGGELRGQGTCRGGRYFVTVHADGGERVSFRLTDIRTGAQYAVDERVTVAQPRLGSLRRPVELHSAAATQGVGTVQSSEFIVHSYDLLGRPVPESHRGAVTIQRTADGRVRKVVTR